MPNNIDVNSENRLQCGFVIFSIVLSYLAHFVSICLNEYRSVLERTQFSLTCADRSVASAAAQKATKRYNSNIIYDHTQSAVKSRSPFKPGGHQNADTIYLCSKLQ